MMPLIGTGGINAYIFTPSGVSLGASLLQAVTVSKTLWCFGLIRGTASPSTGKLRFPKHMRNSNCR